MTQINLATAAQLAEVEARTSEIIDVDAGFAGDIQDAIDYVSVNSIPAVLHLASPLYTPAAELEIPHDGPQIHLRGGLGHAYSQSTVIRALTARRSVIVDSRQMVQLSRLTLDANRQATYGLLCDEAGYSKFSNLWITKALFDGVRLLTLKLSDGSGTMNDGINIDELWLDNCGTWHYAGAFNLGYHHATYKATTTGTVSIAEDDDVITGVGTAFLSLNARPGDFIQIGIDLATAEFYQILTVDSNTQITIRGTANATASGVGYAVGVGDGWHEQRHGDNNVAHFTKGLFRGCGGSGMKFNGLYGPTAIAPQMDYNGMFGVVIGDGYSAAPVYASSFISPYCEGNAGGYAYFGSASGVTITSPLYDQPAGASATPWRMASAAENFGIVTPAQNIITGNGGIRVLEAIGQEDYVRSTVPTEKTIHVKMMGKRYVASFPGGSQVIDAASDQISPDTFLVPLYVSGTVSLTTAPVIAAGEEGQEIMLLNVNTGSVTLPDKSQVSGSQFHFVASTITLAPQASVRCRWNGTHFVQIGPVVTPL